MGLTTADCSGLCPKGYWGANSGQGNPFCNGNCQPGFICAEGSTLPNSVPCPAGSYCPGGPDGANSPITCPPGTWSGPGADHCESCKPVGIDDVSVAYTSHVILFLLCCMSIVSVRAAHYSHFMLWSIRLSPSFAGLLRLQQRSDRRHLHRPLSSRSALRSCCQRCVVTSTRGLAVRAALLPSTAPANCAPKWLLCSLT